MPFYILLFLYLAPVCLALYWLTKLVVWIIKKVFQLVIWIVKTFFVLLSRLVDIVEVTDSSSVTPTI